MGGHNYTRYTVTYQIIISTQQRKKQHYLFFQGHDTKVKRWSLSLFLSFISSSLNNLSGSSDNKQNMLSTTGRKEKLAVSTGSYIEVSSDEHYHATGNVWYHGLLQENLASSKRKKLSVLHLNPLSNEDYSPPLITTAFHRLIRPVPPPDPFPEVGFEKGDMIDAAHKGGWWSGWVIKVLGERFLVYLRFEPDVIEVERKDMRPHWVWKDAEWFRCEKRVGLLLLLFKFPYLL